MKGFDEPIVLKHAPAGLPDLEAELREHLARRPGSDDMKALSAWVAEKNRLVFWIELSRKAAVPPKFERVELPAPACTALHPPAPPEEPMAYPKGKPMSEETKEKIRVARRTKAEGPPVAPPGVQSLQSQPGTLAGELLDLQARVAVLLSRAIPLPAKDRAELVEPAANLDALAHELAVYLHSGRIEVSA